MSDRTKVLSVHRVRRTASKRERAITAAVNRAANSPIQTSGPVMRLYVGGRDGGPVDWPLWARGVRVEKAGLLQWAVVATEHRGR